MVSVADVVDFGGFRAEDIPECLVVAVAGADSPGIDAVGVLVDFDIVPGAWFGSGLAGRVAGGFPSGFHVWNGLGYSGVVPGPLFQQPASE